MRSVPKSRVVRLGIKVWNNSPIRPFDELMGIDGSIFGKYVEISCCTFGFSSRDGIVMNTGPQLVGSVGSEQYVVVLLATSDALS